MQLKLSVGKGRQVIKIAMPQSVAILHYTVAIEHGGYVLYRALVLLNISGQPGLCENKDKMNYYRKVYTTFWQNDASRSNNQSH